MHAICSVHGSQDKEMFGCVFGDLDLPLVGTGIVNNFSQMHSYSLTLSSDACLDKHELERFRTTEDASVRGQSCYQRYLFTLGMRAVLLVQHRTGILKQRLA